MRPVQPTSLLLEFEGGDGNALRAIVSGEIDFASAPSMQARLIAAFERERTLSLILDLGAVEFIDSSGLRVLLHIQRELSAGHGALLLLCPTEEVRRILKLTGLDQHLTLADSLEQANALLSEMSTDPEDRP